MKKQGGFTLLEIMLSLMIVGLIASVAGSAIVAGLNGYLAAKDNQSLAQKSQLAMLRVSRHLSEFVNIPNQSTPRVSKCRATIENNHNAVASMGNPMAVLNFSIHGPGLGRKRSRAG